MSNQDPPAPTITQRAAATKSAMHQVRQHHASRKVEDALRIRNGPQVTHLYGLPINSPVLVWRENRGWTGPYSLLNITGQECVVDLPKEPTTFRVTVVKPYYIKEQNKDNSKVDISIPDELNMKVSSMTIQQPDVRPENGISINDVVEKSSQPNTRPENIYDVYDSYNTSGYLLPVFRKVALVYEAPSLAVIEVQLGLSQKYLFLEMLMTAHKPE
ncbi:hypothetical protein EV44_g3264 [Erysiphe necator]|uniref:Uncharacterized protein n=1 Tax=Uncinula necator TaxID=52586 RepID=A0A0B1P3L4_UNCNE|nr:hypothetical protein EV44_g3264 [Erysiphe necator]